MRILAEDEWRALTAAHEARVDTVTAGHRARRLAGAKHPVEDFLFTYYGWTPGRLGRWHPGAGVGLAPARATPHIGWRFYRRHGDVVSVDVAAFLEARGDTMHFVRELVARTAGRAGRFGCFGLHEWAMVYRLPQADVRHSAWPLRLGRDGTDAVVEANQVACSHFDAYRFFTPDAVPRNALRPTRASQAAYEQPGCLHAGMDLYKWSMKLSPAIGSDLAIDAFDLAREIRELDMRASPYDLRALGYEPVRIETPEGKAQYVEGQRRFSERSQALRARLLATIDGLLAASPGRTR
ncbi:MAG TPA: 3-methyladenine DNA glycosylase [Intrasporangium sp.]|uniref:3-methyladenine DNA glycosylase n=1 Tax=Intrasporangium sp. TaxID=1925024 RepID=UPI002B47A73A|nr:3-methyladenine DNA glycosylase [Intrasporangium sp.]HKX67236.1 3-methyladenine DNA glycosylase [Intrasporangium sp.]